MLQNHEDFYGYVIEIKANSVVLHDMRVHEIYSAEVPSSGEVMNEWSPNSTPPLWLNSPDKIVTCTFLSLTAKRLKQASWNSGLVRLSNIVHADPKNFRDHGCQPNVYSPLRRICYYKPIKQACLVYFTISRVHIRAGVKTEISCKFSFLVQYPPPVPVSFVVSKQGFQWSHYFLKDL